ncbi:unnamed protein product [marine sediment metagenome]|uniref:Uncharacterized protein n=1 Tax=marine sediment metagenome TaxID=412755 RepID=X1FIC6_9ZZZZ
MGTKTNKKGITFLKEFSFRNEIYLMLKCEKCERTWKINYIQPETEEVYEEIDFKDLTCPFGCNRD